MIFLDKRFAVFMFLLVAILFLSSCLRMFFIKMEGRLGEKIVFYFYDSLQDKEPTKQNITSFYVKEYHNKSEGIVIWYLSGEAKLTNIVYGQSYKGLTEKVSPKELKKNTKYCVVADDLPIIDPRGFAGVCFYFDDSGNLYWEHGDISVK